MENKTGFLVRKCSIGTVYEQKFHICWGNVNLFYYVIETRRKIKFNLQLKVILAGERSFMWLII